MDQQTTGIVCAVAKQWWLKVNTKAFRMHPLDGATFPHIIKVKYTVNGTEHTKRKWINAGQPVPEIGGTVQVRYSSNKPSRAKVL